MCSEGKVQKNKKKKKKKKIRKEKLKLKKIKNKNRDLKKEKKTGLAGFGIWRGVETLRHRGRGVTAVVFLGGAKKRWGGRMDLKSGGRGVA